MQSQKDAARFGYLDAMWRPFFSSEFYADVALRWRGTGLLWLCLLLMLTWIPPTGKLVLGLRSFVETEEMLPMMLEQIPPTVIENGTATVDAQMPHEIVVEEGGESVLLAIFDTTGEVTDLNDTEAMMLVTETDVQIREQNGGTRIHQLTKFQDRLEITPAIVQSWVDKGVRWFTLGAYPVFLLCSLLWQIPKALLLGLIGMLFVQRLRPAPGYTGMLRVAVFAMTPVILADTIMWMLPIPLPGWWLFCLVVPFAYIYLAARGIKAEQAAVRESLTPDSTDGFGSNQA